MKDKWFVKEVSQEELSAELNAFDEQGYGIYKLEKTAESERTHYWTIIAMRKD